MSAKTLFTKNVEQTTNNVFTVAPVIVNTTIPVIPDENIYKVLSDYSITLKNLLYNFSLGRFQYVASIFTIKYYRTLSIEISNMKYPDYPIYEQLRQTIKYSLQGLYKAVNEHIILIDTKSKLEIMTDKASILNDMQRLKTYVEGLRGSTYLFPDLIISAPLAVIKQEYIEYIRLYGFPEGGVFDMEKLALILITMAFLT